MSKDKINVNLLKVKTTVNINLMKANAFEKAAFLQASIGEKLEKAKSERIKRAQCILFRAPNDSDLDNAETVRGFNLPPRAYIRLSTTKLTKKDWVNKEKVFYYDSTKTNSPLTLVATEQKWRWNITQNTPIQKFDSQVGSVTENQRQDLTADKLSFVEYTIGHKRDQADMPGSEKLAGLITKKAAARIQAFVDHYKKVLDLIQDAGSDPQNEALRAKIKQISGIFDAAQKLAETVVWEYHVSSEDKAKKAVKQALKEYRNTTLALSEQHKSLQTRSVLIGGGLGTFVGIGIGLLLGYFLPGIGLGVLIPTVISAGIGLIAGLTGGGIFGWHRVYVADLIVSQARQLGNFVEELISKSETQLEEEAKALTEDVQQKPKFRKSTKKRTDDDQDWVHTDPNANFTKEQYKNAEPSEDIFVNTPDANANKNGVNPNNRIDVRAADEGSSSDDEDNVVNNNRTQTAAPNNGGPQSSFKSALSKATFIPDRVAAARARDANNSAGASTTPGHRSN